jgi:Rrf2 family protein
MLSNSCRYGIKAVIYLAKQSESNGKIGIKKISTDLNLPTPYLAKILQQLAKQKILSSAKGPHGGFSLLKDPAKITLIDIIVCIDGNDVFSNCVMYTGTCTGRDKDGKRCPLHEDYEETRKDLVKLFSNRSVYDLVKGNRKDEMKII